MGRPDRKACQAPGVEEPREPLRPAILTQRVAIGLHRIAARKQPPFRSRRLPPRAQQVEQMPILSAIRRTEAGWEVIAPIYLRLGRFDDAVKARRQALRLNGDSVERESALGEALVFAANGIVTAEAKAAFEKAVALDASDVPARYFLGLAAEQDGNRAQAAAMWRAPIAAAPPDAPWIEFIRAALARVDDGAASDNPSRGASGGQSAKPGAGPTEDQVAASSNRDPEQRKAMIQGMVERLSEKLHRDGSDAEGWLRLVRSYMVLGEREKARAAVLNARRALAGDPTNLRRLDDLVKGLGLEG